MKYRTDSETIIQITGAKTREIILPENYDIPIGNIALFYSSKTTSTANASFDNFNIISTIEHSDPFRAEHTYQPRLQYLRSKIHEKLKSFFN